MKKETNGSSLPLGSNSAPAIAVFAPEKDKAFAKIAGLLMRLAYDSHRTAGYTPDERLDDTGRGFLESEMDCTICAILGLPVLSQIAVSADPSRPGIILDKDHMCEMKNKTVAELERLGAELEQHWKATRA